MRDKKVRGTGLSVLVLGVTLLTAAEVSILQHNAEVIQIESSNIPSWKATFEKSRGGALMDLRVPTVGPDNLVQTNLGGILRGGFQVYLFTEGKTKVLGTSPARMDRFDVIVNTPQLIRIAAEGISQKNLYEFNHTLTIKPSGIRLDGKLTLKERGFYFALHNNFSGGGTSEVNLERKIKFWDADTDPVDFLIESTADSRPSYLPPDIDYPCELQIGCAKNPEISFRLSALKVPQVIKDGREFFAPDWQYHRRFRVQPIYFMKFNMFVKPGIYEYAWSLQMAKADGVVPFIPGPNETIVEKTQMGSYKNMDIHVLPNLDSGNNVRLMLHFVHSGGFAIKVYDILGKEIGAYRKETQGTGLHCMDWNLSNRIGKGLYMLLLKQGHQVATQKLRIIK